MFIGHLPAGYLLTEKLQKHLKLKGYVALGLIASVVPDFDLFYFYLFDERANFHHSYWTHIPFYWLLIAIFTALVLMIFKQRRYFGAALIFFSNIFLHLFLDTIVGKIEWLSPFNETSFAFFEVPARYNWWVWNFVFHWTFLFEIVIVVWALYHAYVLFSRKK